MRYFNLLSLLPFLLLLNGCDSQAAADAGHGRNHRVQSGETLFSIAEVYYGDGLEWSLIWDANPWLDPEHLRAGETIYIPPTRDAWANPPPPPPEEATSIARDPGTRRVMGSSGSGGSADPGFKLILNDIKQNVTKKTIFGVTLDKALFVLCICFLLHALLQTLLVWLAAHITFVKEVSFKKSMKAVCMTEMLTFTTLVVVTAVGILLVSLGSTSGADGGGQLFPALEGYLQGPAGIIVAGLVLLALYITLSLRFLPQVFNVPMSHAIAVMAIAILIPHLIGAYLIGHRTGLIH